MKRLRHPVRAIREPFGTAGLIVACVALVLALTGAAFAAAGLTGKQKKEVEKIAKKVAGKPGAPGAAGPQGPAGTNGTNGKDGTNGTNGKDGNGTNGTSATTVSFSGPAHGCAKGGSEVKSASAPVYICNGESGETPTGTTFTGAEEETVFGAGEKPCNETGGIQYQTAAEEQVVCNGAQGPQGIEGKPWTAGGTLPSGAIETGTWMLSGSGNVSTSLSFPIHLAGNVTAAKVFYGNEEEPEIEVSPGVFEMTEFRKHCPATALSPTIESPTTNTRTLCVYYFTQSTAASFVSVTKNSENKGAGFSGGFLSLNITEPGTVYGSFAVSGG
jgi:hypothetical protein